MFYIQKKIANNKNLDYSFDSKSYDKQTKISKDSSIKDLNNSINKDFIIDDNNKYKDDYKDLKQNKNLNLKTNNEKQKEKEMNKTSEMETQTPPLKIKVNNVCCIRRLFAKKTYRSMYSKYIVSKMTFQPTRKGIVDLYQP